MKLVFEPSAKRMIPYPPVGVGILARSVQESAGISAQVFDLEVELNHASHVDGPTSAAERFAAWKWIFLTTIFRTISRYD